MICVQCKKECEDRYEEYGNYCEECDILAEAKAYIECRKGERGIGNAIIRFTLKNLDIYNTGTKDEKYSKIILELWKNPKKLK